jgi:hypothetical protein
MNERLTEKLFRQRCIKAGYIDGQNCSIDEQRSSDKTIDSKMDWTDKADKRAWTENKFIRIKERDRE